MKSQRLTYNVIYQAEAEGGYTASVPVLPGCITYGRTIDEAQDMIKDAITAYIASLHKHREIIPVDQSTFSGTVDITDRSRTRATRSQAYA